MVYILYFIAFIFNILLFISAMNEKILRTKSQELHKTEMFNYKNG